MMIETYVALRSMAAGLNFKIKFEKMPAIEPTRPNTESIIGKVMYNMLPGNAVVAKIIAATMAPTYD